MAGDGRRRDLLQLLGELERGRVAIGGQLCQRPLYCEIHRFRHGRTEKAHTRHQVHVPSAGVRHFTREHFIQHAAQTVDVASPIHLGARCLLRAHVCRRTDRDAGPGQRVRDAECPSDPEVSHQHLTATGEQNVLRLDVAVNHAVLVRVVQRNRGVVRDAERVSHRELFLPKQPVAETLAVHVRPGEPELAGDFARVEYGGDDAAGPRSRSRG